jgi:HSP20 family protein
MAITRWNPARELETMRAAMDHLSDSFWTDRAWPTNDSGQRVACLPLDVYSTENDIVVMAALPGIDPESVDITVSGDTLTIKGEVPRRLENVDYVFAERFHGPFSRTLKLSVPVDVDAIEAHVEGGILTLVLPKAEEVRPRVIKVKAK